MSDISASSKAYANYSNILVSENSYQVTVKNVMDTTYTAMNDFTSTVQAFIDTAAPTVTKTEYVGGVVKVHFNEPIDPSAATYKIDGCTTTAVSTSKIDGTDYTLEFVPTADQKAVGDHTITLYGVKDALGNTLDIASGSYTVSADTTAPTIASVTSYGQDTFKVKFSEALSGNPVVTVKKGSLTLNTVSCTLDTSDSSNTTYIVKVAGLDSINNPLYASGESSINLNVDVKGYSDTSNNTGAEYTQGITLTKDTTAPTVVNTGLNKGVVVAGSNNDQLNVVFNKDLNTTVDSTKVTVLKDGIALTTIGTSSIINDADSNLRVLQINLGADLTPGTYTVQLGAGAVADTNGNKNAALDTTVNYTDSTTFVNAAISTYATNVFQIVYTSSSDMTDSATTLSNYTLDGAALPSGTTVSFYGDKKTVRITLPAGSEANTTTGLLKVSKNVVNTDGVKVLASVNPEVEAKNYVNITDNVKPSTASAKYLLGTSADTTTNKIDLTFSENLGSVTDNANSRNDFKVLVNGVKQTVANVIDGTSGDKDITLVLASPINISQASTISIVPEADQDDATASNNVISITDVAGNKATEGSTVTAAATQVDANTVNATAAQTAINSIVGGSNVATTAVDTTTGNVTVTPTANVTSTTTLSQMGVANATNLANAINNGAQSITLKANGTFTQQTVSLTGSSASTIKAAIAQAVLGDSTKGASDFDNLTEAQLKAYANTYGLQVTVNGVAHTVTVA